MELPASAIKPQPPKGLYAAVPGSGPAGETCGSCGNLYRRSLASDYLKCLLVKSNWTGGAGTDVKARAPACKYWIAVDVSR
jgi:hypothetical protein